MHGTRVAIRRVRSTLRVFAELLDPRAVAMDGELRWLAALFGDVRDADVLRERLFAALDDLPAEQVRGSVRDELDQSIGSDRQAALRRWRHERDGDRYRSAMAALDTWQREPPLRAGVNSEDVAHAASATLARARRRAMTRLASAGDDPVRLHRARKAVKRLRYAADLLAPVLPEAAEVAERAARVQGILGDHQDLVVEAEFLRRPGHDGFTDGLLMARAEQEAAAIRASLRISIDLDMG